MSLIGAVLSLLALPLVIVTTQALVELWPARPPQADEILFLDYQTFPVFEWAFVASQGWLLCALTMWRMPSAPKVLRGLVLVVAAEALVVYGIVGFLRARALVAPPEAFQLRRSEIDAPGHTPGFVCVAA